MIDEFSMRNFLQWAEIEKHGLIEWRTLRYAGGKYSQKASGFTKDPIVVIANANTMLYDEMFVIGINPRYSESMNKDKDIQIYKNIYLDIEPIHLPSTTVTEEERLQCREFMKKFCNNMGWNFIGPSSTGTPCVVGNSGNGFHIFFAVPPQVPQTFYDHLKTWYDLIISESAELRSQYNIRIDNTLSPSRQIKLYGTAKPIPGSVISKFLPKPRVEVPVLAKYIMELKPKSSVVVDVDLMGDKDFDCVVSKYNLEKESKYCELFEGVIDLTDNSRSGKDMALASYLAYKGLTASEICAIIISTPYNVGKQFKEAYLTHTIGKAMENRIEERNSFNTPMTEGEVPPPILSTKYNIKGPELIKFSSIRNTKFAPPVLIPTGIQILDEMFFDGGLAKRELSMIIAEQETGKTTLACVIGCNAAKAGYKVLHITYEDEMPTLHARYNIILQGAALQADPVFLNCTASPGALSHIEKAIHDTRPDLVLLDYFVRIPGVTESRFCAKDALGLLGNITKNYDCHIAIFDHVTITSDYNKSHRMTMGRLNEAKMYKSAFVKLMLGMMKDRQNDNQVWFTRMKCSRKAGKALEPFLVDWSRATYTHIQQEFIGGE